MRTSASLKLLALIVDQCDCVRLNLLIVALQTIELDYDFAISAHFRATDDLMDSLVQHKQSFVFHMASVSALVN